MRICALPTNSMTCFQSMECQSVGPLGDAALLPVCPIPFSDEVRPIEEGTDPEGQIPSGSLISRSGLTLPHLRQVCSLSLRHGLSDPLQTGIRFLPLPLPAMPWPTNISVPGLPRPRTGRHIGFTSFLPMPSPVATGPMGLGTQISAAGRAGNERQYMTCRSRPGAVLAAAPLRGGRQA